MAILAATGLLSAAVPASAAAEAIELGATKTPLIAPSCPPGVSASSCTIVLTEVTALETIRDSAVYPTTVTKAGYVVAFTLGLSRLDKDPATAKSDVHFLDTTYGGTAQAAITVLKPVGTKRLRRWSVVGESPAYHLQPYLGEIVQFPLATSIPVVPGEVVALTVPTWAPVLSFDLPAKKFAYRQSRRVNCGNPAASSQAQLTVGATAAYHCNYPGTRVEYSATEITTPVPTKDQIRVAGKS